MNLKIRQADVQDAGGVYRIMRAAFEEYRGKLSPPSGALRETLEEAMAAIESGGAFLAEIDGVLAGSARYRIRENHLYAERVAVLPQHRKKGIAAALMQAVEDVAREWGISEVQVGVRAALPANLRFYEKLGYRALSSLPYSTGNDFGITLSKRIGV